MAALQTPFPTPGTDALTARPRRWGGEVGLRKEECRVSLSTSRKFHTGEWKTGGVKLSETEDSLCIKHYFKLQRRSPVVNYHTRLMTQLSQLPVVW